MIPFDKEQEENMYIDGVTVMVKALGVKAREQVWVTVEN